MKISHVKCSNSTYFDFTCGIFTCGIICEIDFTYENFTCEVFQFHILISHVKLSHVKLYVKFPYAQSRVRSVLNCEAATSVTLIAISYATIIIDSM